MESKDLIEVLIDLIRAVHRIEAQLRDINRTLAKMEKKK